MELEKIKNYIVKLLNNTEFDFPKEGKIYCLIEYDIAFIGPHVDISLYNENKEFIFHTSLRDCDFIDRTILVYDIDNKTFSCLENC